MEKKQRYLFWLTVFICAGAVAMLAASLGTDYWIIAYPVRNVSQNAIDSAKNLSGEIGTKFRGEINFGLFHGIKILDYGFSTVGREEEIWVAIQVTKHGLFNFGLWVSTIVFATLGVVWGLVAMGFAILNGSTRPIETITGPMGLYVWNGLACLFSLLCAILYVVLYFKDLKQNVMSKEDRENYWISTDRAYLSYSFYFVIIAAVCFLINIVIVVLSGTKLHGIRHKANMNEKAMDGVMMY